MTQITIPPLAKGEVYLCGIVDANGDVEHTVLLPGDSDDDTHENQIAWAKSIGGVLPNRIEQAVMLANDAFIAACNRDGSILQYQLMTQDEDENYHYLHNERRFFNTKREAIDAAMEAARTSTGDKA